MRQRMGGGGGGLSGLTYRSNNTPVSPASAAITDITAANARSQQSSRQCQAPKPVEEVDGAIAAKSLQSTPTMTTPQQRQHLKLRDIPAVSYSSSEEDDEIYYDTRENVASLSPSVTSELFESGSDEK